MQLKTKLDSREAHRQAGICALFQWQDRAAEGYLDAKSVSLDTTDVLGTLPEPLNGAPVYVVQVEGTATSVHGYSYPLKETLKVYLKSAEEDEADKPVVDDASDEEVAACEQHNRDMACKEYAELSHIAEVGAYSEGDNGECWYPDEENGIDISARLIELEQAALEEGLHFAPASPVRPDGFADIYKLEPATAEELAAHKKAKEEAEAAEWDEE
jgi:hypothetical protein